MTVHRCTCGFTEASEDDEMIVDHFLRVFALEGDKGADGQVHLEGKPAWACLCGFRASMSGELDSHFLEMFIPVDRMDSGGVRHEVTHGEQRI